MRVNQAADFTGNNGSPSGRMANASVNRDLGALQEFVRSRFVLRTLDRYIQVNTQLRRNLDRIDGPEYLAALMKYRHDADVLSDARAELRQFHRPSDYDVEGNDEDEYSPELQAILDDTTLDDFDKVVRVLEEGHGSQPLENAIRWYYSVFGLRRTDGLLDGSIKGRRVWYYRMSDPLLEALVQLCSVLPEYNGSRPDTGVSPRPITLNRFIDFLRDRYGILVDTPPEWMGSTENIAGARENFDALKYRLRQMGLFDDLSDDFNVQRIRPRFTRIREDRNETDWR
jgi:hypothetical protein